MNEGSMNFQSVIIKAMPSYLPVLSSPPPKSSEPWEVASLAKGQVFKPRKDQGSRVLSSMPYYREAFLATLPTIPVRPFVLPSFIYFLPLVAFMPLGT